MGRPSESFVPSGLWIDPVYPGLTPWAALFRRFAAGPVVKQLRFAGRVLIGSEEHKRFMFAIRNTRASRFYGLVYDGGHLSVS